MKPSILKTCMKCKCSVKRDAIDTKCVENIPCQGSLVCMVTMKWNFAQGGRVTNFKKTSLFQPGFNCSKLTEICSKLTIKIRERRQ